MRAERLLSILLLLQLHKRMTTAQLAKQLHVSERTVHRDMEALSFAGFPIYSERGKHGGWGLLADYQTKLTHLNVNELPALFLTVSSKLLEDLGLKESAKLAQQKLLSTLPKDVQTNAQHLSQRIYLDTTGWHPKQKEHPSFHALLQQALWETKRVHLTYPSASAPEHTQSRLVNPLGLVAKGTSWYLVASADEKIRTYRVSRILDAELSDETFPYPADFELEAYWEQSSRQFINSLPSYVVIARTKPEIVDKLKSFGRLPIIEVLDSDGKDRVTVSLQFQVEQEACSFLMGWGSQIEVIEPPALRMQLVRLAREIISMYGNAPSVTN